MYYVSIRAYSPVFIFQVSQSHEWQVTVTIREPLALLLQHSPSHTHTHTGPWHIQPWWRDTNDDWRLKEHYILHILSTGCCWEKMMREGVNSITRNPSSPSPDQRKKDRAEAGLYKNGIRNEWKEYLLGNRNSDVRSARQALEKMQMWGREWVRARIATHSLD
jgi:hypothetical protein